MNLQNNVVNIKDLKKIIRGQVWLIDLGDGIGSEQKFKRPCIIIQNNKGNTYAPTVTIIPLTSSKSKNNLPTHIDFEEDFLEFKSIAMIEQIRTIDKLRLIKLLGEISEDVMKKIEIAIDIQAKEFDYNEIYNLYQQILNIKNVINKCGKIQELIETYNYLINEFKKYCIKYDKNYKHIIEELKINYKIDCNSSYYKLVK